MNHRRRRPRKQPNCIMSSSHRIFEPRRDAVSCGGKLQINENPTAILDDWADSEPEDKAAADDKWELDRWSDYYRQTAALDDDDPHQETLRPWHFIGEQIREHAG